MDWTRGPWAGGTAPDWLLVHGVPGGRPAINHDTHPCALAWLGLAVVVREAPRPPPTWPTITIDVGMLFGDPLVVNERLLVRLISRPPAAPTGTVINTGDQAGLAAATAPLPPPPVSVIVGAAV